MQPPQRQSSKPTTGILLTNIGSPQAPTPEAVKTYLSEFLADRRIIDWPRWLWLPILRGIVLRVRPKRSAALYQNIWDDGSPLLKIAVQQTALLEKHMAGRGLSDLKICLGMRYGEPSIPQALRSLRQSGVERILVFPLFPQYSLTTTESTFDAVREELSRWDTLPELEFIRDYFQQRSYITALANSIQERWDSIGMPQKLLFSFHGVPQRYGRKSEISYTDQCKKTAELVAQRLEIPTSGWSIAFQSRFGPEPWLQPYTDETLANWGETGIDNVHVICPGFSADCLETLDEIDREARLMYEEAGGRSFHYIPALNTRPDHIKALGEILASHLHAEEKEPTRRTSPIQSDFIEVS